ncbi:MAG: hypothetical protein QHH04_05110 [Methanolinea sp.]|nr:hypothetical protein [Methanolinea sp.]
MVNEDARDFVAGSSSPAAPSRSSRTVARTARRCWLECHLLVSLDITPGECRRVEPGGTRCRPQSSR